MVDVGFRGQGLEFICIFLISFICPPEYLKFKRSNGGSTPVLRFVEPFVSVDEWP